MTANNALISPAEIFPWSDNFATGIESIDVQHHQLVNLLNQLAAHMAYGSDEVTLYRVFDELAEYAVYHFQTEETIWNQYLGGDAMSLTHTKTHQDFVAEVVRVRSVRGALSNEQATEQMVSFLTHWLAFHILEDDTHMAHIVLGLQRGESLERAKETAKLRMSGAAHMLIQAVLSMYDNLSARTMALLREINQRRRAEERLRLSNIIVESSTDAIFITNPQGLISEVNPAFCQSVQQAREALLGQTIAAVQPESFASDKGRAIWETTLQSGQWAGELSSRRPDGELETVWLKLSIIKDEVLETQHVVGIVSSISQLVQHHHTLEVAANHDALTGLPNRRLLDDRLAQALERSKRNSTILAIGLLDLDAFKPINDTLGHAVGDQVLRVVAQRMTQALRGADTVARLGGDEFVVLLGDLSAANEARPLLERLLHDVSQPMDVDHRVVQVGVSMGVMLYPTDCADAGELLKYADVAMYVAKAQGKACLKFYSETAIE